MLADTIRKHAPLYQYAKQTPLSQPIRYSTVSPRYGPSGGVRIRVPSQLVSRLPGRGGYRIRMPARPVYRAQGPIRSGLRVRVPVRPYTRVPARPFNQMPVRPYNQVPARALYRGPVRGLNRVPVHQPYVSYAPVASNSFISIPIWPTFFTSTLGKILLGLGFVALVAAVVVGTVVPLKKSGSQSSVASANPAAAGATNPESQQYMVNFTTSSNLTSGNITDAATLAVLQAQLDNVTQTYASQISPCTLQLVSATVTSSNVVSAITTLNCGVLCTGSCSSQKASLYTAIIGSNPQAFYLSNFSTPDSSNRTRRLVRHVLPLEQESRVQPGVIIDGRTIVGTNGFVVSVSFYADQSCSEQTIQFGAFEMNDHQGEEAEFTVHATSGPLVVSKNEFVSASIDNKMKLVTIPLCSKADSEDPLNGANCQGVQFPIRIREYFGSFSTECSLGSTTLEKIDDAHTYANIDDGDSFQQPFRRLRYKSLGKQDVLQVPTIVSWELGTSTGEKSKQQGIMQTPSRVIFLGTYPPRGCGLATFLHDIVVNYDEEFHTTSKVIAIDEKATPADRVYPSRVVARLNQTERDSHLNIAKFINDLNDTDVLNIQHEFGLFGGQAGEWILHLISSVKKPVLVTFHTVLQDPAPIYYSITRAICSSASGIIVLSYAGRDILVKVYQIDISKIHVVPHGIPDVSFMETLPTKRQLDFGNRVTMATFGLIGRSKGLEYAVRAVKLAVKQVPNLLYIILGATHPVILKEVGEEYREGLQNMINNLSLTNNVKLVNRYLDKKELLTYLSAVDIYLTPYPNPDQVVSGTLSIAVGCGKAVVSTPYIYAKEILASGRGFLVPFKDDAFLSQTIVRLATDVQTRDSARRRAYKYGRKMIWSRVVIELARIYQNALLDM